MPWLLAPFDVSFVQRAFVAGALLSVVCALVGTWVVLRGMAFLGDAMAHGMLPGVALAALAGVDLRLGAVATAAVMAAGVSAVGRSTAPASTRGRSWRPPASRGSRLRRGRVPPVESRARRPTRQ